MKTNLIKKKIPLVAKAFTLVEMTLVAIVGILIAGMSMTLFNSQLTSFQIIKTQDFLIHEAPQINNTLNQIIPRANFFRLYPTIGDAQGDQNSTITDATVMVLQFQDPTVNTAAQNNTIDAVTYGIIAFDPATNNLEYYSRTTLQNLDLSVPSWTISTQTTGVTFFVQQGVLRTRVTGPNGGQITHSTTTIR